MSRRSSTHGRFRISAHCTSLVATIAYKSCWNLQELGGSAVVVAKKEPFSLIFAPVVHDHLAAIDAKYDSLIRQTIDEQLIHQPDVATRNRKPVRPPAVFQAEWELRFGPNNRFRVFYQIDHAKREVRVVAVGVKDRNRLLVGGEEVTQ